MSDYPKDVHPIEEASEIIVHWGKWYDFQDACYHAGTYDGFDFDAYAPEDQERLRVEFAAAFPRLVEES